MNHVTRYLSTTKASQRETVIREAKFPKKIPVAIYGQAKPQIHDFFPHGGGDLAYFDEGLARLDAKARRDETKRDEALRCIRAIEAFKRLYGQKRWNNLHFGPEVANVPLKVGEVLINVRLDATISQSGSDGTLNSGGIVVFLATTPESRKNIEIRRRHVASLILWALEVQGNIEPLPRLCMSFDAFGEELTKASSSQSTFRSNVESSCREAALMWDGVQPPEGYDGPDWN